MRLLKAHVPAEIVTVPPPLTAAWRTAVTSPTQLTVAGGPVGLGVADGELLGDAVGDAVALGVGVGGITVDPNSPLTSPLLALDAAPSSGSLYASSMERSVP